MLRSISWWSGDIDGSEIAINKAASQRTDDFKSLPKAKQPAEKKSEFKVGQGPTVWSGNPNINPDPEGLTGREAEHDERGMKDWYASSARQRIRDRVASQSQPRQAEHPRQAQIGRAMRAMRAQLRYQFLKAIGQCGQRKRSPIS